MKQDHTLEWTLGIFLFALFVGFLLLLHEIQKLNNQIYCDDRDVDSTKVFNQSNYQHLGIKCCAKVKYDYIDNEGILHQGSYKNCTFKTNKPAIKPVIKVNVDCTPPKENYTDNLSFWTCTKCVNDVCETGSITLYLKR